MKPECSHHQHRKRPRHSFPRPLLSLWPAIRPSWFSLCLFILLSFATNISVTSAATLSHPADFSDVLNIPSEYGDVIYRINPESNRQLYVIGIRHRSPNSETYDRTTLKAQKEIYRIGEWLSASLHTSLLLPEGYFNSDQVCSPNPPGAVRAVNQPALASISNETLEKELSSTRSFKNAEMLLMETLDFRACQVENPTLYNAVRKSLRRLASSNNVTSGSTNPIEEIQYLQEIRTAQLLQTIPGVIEEQFEFGTAGKRSAIFTIGLNHIKHIFRYIENGSIDIATSSQGKMAYDSVSSTLNLIKAGYGVTIIIPRTLADNDKLLEITQIDRILLADGNF